MSKNPCTCGHESSRHGYGYYQCYAEDCGCMKFKESEAFPSISWTKKMADAEDKCESVNVNSEAMLDKVPIDVGMYTQRIFDGLFATKRLPAKICAIIAEWCMYMSEQPDVEEASVEAIDRYFLSDAEYAERWL